jgi:hypothetical protein
MEEGGAILLFCPGLHTKLLVLGSNYSLKEGKALLLHVEVKGILFSQVSRGVSVSLRSNPAQRSASLIN